MFILFYFLFVCLFVNIVHVPGYCISFEHIISHSGIRNEPSPQPMWLPLHVLHPVSSEVSSLRITATHNHFLMKILLTLWCLCGFCTCEKGARLTDDTDLFVTRVARRQATLPLYDSLPTWLLLARKERCSVAASLPTVSWQMPTVIMCLLVSSSRTNTEGIN